jgi:DNA-binding transcriptional ArsR family regulator
MLYKSIHSMAIVQALSHPLRARMLSVLQEREASPKELAEHFGAPLANVAYHIQVLRKLKLIRLVRKTRRRGAIEHHYKADYLVHIDHETWSGTPGVIKERMIAGILEEIGEHVTSAAATGGFGRDNAHITRTRAVLDAKAWDALAAKLDEVLELIGELEKESAVRLRRSNHEDERRMGLVMMMFESVPGISDADAARLPDAGHPDARQPEPARRNLQDVSA